MRNVHFETSGDNKDNGTKYDPKKGTFLPTVTDRDLAKIVDTGLQDQGPWTLNKDNYYEKTFAYSGIGKRSATFGNGLPSNTVTLVVEQFPEPKYGTVEIVTMYPADA